MLNLLAAFPLLLISVIIYALYVMATGGPEVAAALDVPLFDIPITSGDELAFTMGNLFVLISFIFLFIEIVKSTSSGSISIMNHGLSAAVLVLCIVLMLIVRGYGNTTFLFITLMTAFDVIAGFTITAVTARRDIGFAGGG